MLKQCLTWSPIHHPCYQHLTINTQNEASIVQTLPLTKRGFKDNFHTPKCLSVRMKHGLSEIDTEMSPKRLNLPAYPPQEVRSLDRSHVV